MPKRREHETEEDWMRHGDGIRGLDVSEVWTACEGWYMACVDIEHDTEQTGRQRTERQMQRLTVSDRACKYRAVRYTPLRWPLAAPDTL